MAEIVLHPGEPLPALCIRCGAPAVHFVDNLFRCKPGLFARTRTMTVRVPLCAAHRRHLWWPWIRVAIILAAVAVVMAVRLFLVHVGELDEGAGRLFYYGVLATVTVGYVAVEKLFGPCVAPRSGDEGAMTFVGVSEMFALTLTALRGDKMHGLHAKAAEEIQAALRAAEAPPLTGFPGSGGDADKER
jgi:hypothetical protein